MTVHRSERLAMHSAHLDTLPLDQQQLVRRSAARLEHEFSGTFGRETVERFVADSLEQLVPTSTVTAFSWPPRPRA